MRIGFDAKRAFMNKTGLGVYSRNIINSVSRRMNLVLYTPSVSIPFIKNGDNILIRKMSSWMPKWASGFWRSFVIPQYLAKDEIDLYHGLSAELPIGIPKTIKKVVTIHDLLFERFPSDYPFVDRFFAKRKTIYACKNADRIIAVSESTKKDLVDFYQVSPSQIEVIPVPIHIDENLDEGMSPHPRPYILCVSSFIPRKNQALLIRGFQNLLPNLDFDLVFIGDGREYLSACRSLVNSESQDRIHFKTKIKDVELRSYYRHALFSVYPSKYEGFGIPIIESIGYGCPILVSDNMTHREVGGQIVEYFENDNQESFDFALMNMIKNLNIIRDHQMKDRISLLNQYDSDIISDKVTSLYASLLHT